MSLRDGSPLKNFVSIPDALALAEQHRVSGRLAEADALCRQILEARPDLPEAIHLQGLVAHQNGRLAEAIGHLERATALAPQVALFHANLGEMYRLAGRPKLAVERARQALELEPGMASACSNLGVALYELDAYEEAATAHREAIAADPDFAQAHSNLGNALHALKRFDEAIAAYRRAIALAPDFADAWANLGTTLHHAGQFAEAIVALRRALALAPNHANAHSGLGILLLMRGDLAEGFEEYEWRLSSSERTGPRFPERPWRGESLAGKHIYVQAEQGFGDTFQFVRYLPLLAQRAGAVTVRAHQELLGLLSASLPGVTVLGDRGDCAPFDCDVALLSLPHFFKTRLETIPAPTTYLRVPAADKAKLTPDLGAEPGLKVGLVWAGNPKHTNDFRRSVSLEVLSPLFAVAQTRFFSLQGGARAADLKTTRTPVVDLGKAVEGFPETAATIEALDLVITVDTSIAHLAGALGKPVWVLLPWVTDWRWLLEREDNPWYPTMRLYRQARGSDDWSAVIARMADDLAAVARGDIARLAPFRAEGERRAAEAAIIIAAQKEQVARPQTRRAASAGELLMLAEQHRRRNFVRDADDIVNRVLEMEPDNAEAAHLKGLLAHQSGKLAEAIAYVRRATALAPGVALYHANLGEMCRMAGQVDDAVSEGRMAIALDPASAGAHNNVGIAFFDQGKYEDALGYYERAIALEPSFAQAHSNFGNALQRLKRFAEAEPHYRKALELQPEFADGWNNLGTCLRELKRTEEAEAAYRKALALGPNNPDTLDNLALALKDLERHEEAVALLRKALAVEQREAKFHVHLASILVDQHKTEEAAAVVAQALVLRPDDHDAVNLMGRVAFDRGDLEGALRHYQRALALKPDLADAHNNMGNALKELGRLDDAKAAFEQSLRLDPDNAGVYVNLADSHRFSAGDAHLSRMEALARKGEALSRIDRMRLDFALGKAYADLEDHDRAFRHLLAGNGAKRASIAYDERAALALFERIESVFTRELIAQKKGGGDPSAAPIFVLGMPRSGTTLIEQILASHPMVHGAGELSTLNDVVASVRGADGVQLSYPEFMPALDGGVLRQIGARYVAAVRGLAPGSPRITDKMPSNFYFAGLIHLALPNAKIVHAVRDPVDTCVSCFSKLFNAEQDFAYDLGELGRYHKAYRGLMAHWRRVLPKNAILDVHYEDVVGDLEAAARRILEYCGLPWDARCLSFHKTERPVRTASATQVRRPIYTAAVGRSRAYANHLGPLLDALGSLPQR